MARSNARREVGESIVRGKVQKLLWELTTVSLYRTIFSQMTN
jgi:hypothetical protein